MTDEKLPTQTIYQNKSLQFQIITNEDNTVTDHYLWHDNQWKNF